LIYLLNGYDSIFDEIKTTNKGYAGEFQPKHTTLHKHQYKHTHKSGKNRHNASTYVTMRKLIIDNFGSMPPRYGETR